MINFKFAYRAEKRETSGYGSIRKNQCIEYGTFRDFNYAGVYKIICKNTQKCYIGASTNIAKRLQKHFSELRHNRHKTKMLQEDYNKYGFESFSFKCIEQTNINLLEKEKNYQIQTGIDNLYNEKISGYYISQELLNIRSNTSKSTHKTKEYRDKMSKRAANRFGQFDIYGKLLNVYDNWKDILQNNPKYKIQPIRGVCNGSKKSAYGYIWKYLDNNNNIVLDGYDKRRHNKFEDIV